MKSIKQINEKIDASLLKLKQDFDFMVKPEHSERLWYVIKSFYTKEIMRLIEELEGKLNKLKIRHELEHPSQQYTPMTIEFRKKYHNMTCGYCSAIDQMRTSIKSLVLKDRV